MLQVISAFLPTNRFRFWVRPQSRSFRNPRHFFTSNLLIVA